MANERSLPRFTVQVLLTVLTIAAGVAGFAYLGGMVLLATGSFAGEAAMTARIGKGFALAAVAFLLVAAGSLSLLRRLSSKPRTA